MLRLTRGALLIAVALTANCADDKSPRPDALLGPSAQVAEPAVVPSIPLLRVNAPASIAGDYAAGAATFGPPLTPIGVTGDVNLALDDANPVTDACSALTNAAAVNGKIALVDRGTCAFVTKVTHAQAAGAVAVIVVNNVAGPPPGMGGVDPSITIASVMISQADGSLIKAALASGPVNATLLAIEDKLLAVADVNPKLLNRKARGAYVTAYIEAPAFDVAAIDVATVTLQAIDPVTSVKLNVATGSPTEFGDGNGNGVLDRMVKFDRATVASWFPTDGSVVLRVEGRLLDGRAFTADHNTVRVRVSVTP